MSDGVHEGGCLCGAVRYRIAPGPVLSGTCECRTCRRASGSAMVPWLHVADGLFAITSGTPVEYASSPGILRTFCGRCGTPLTYHKDGYGAAIDVTAASLDAPEAFPPIVHLWTSHRLGWLALQGDIPSLPEGPPDE